LQALAEHLALLSGRKSVYMVTQAFPARLMKGMGQPAWDKTLSALNDANVAVNTVDSRGLMTCPPGRGGCSPQDPMNGTITAMQQIAESTGGKAYFGRNDLDAAMAEGIEAARISYTLAFYLPDNERDNKFHTLKVRADRPGLEFYCRQGYYAGDTDLPPEKSAKGELEASLLTQVDEKGVGITARVDSVPGNPPRHIEYPFEPGPRNLIAERAGLRLDRTSGGNVRRGERDWRNAVEDIRHEAIRNCQCGQRSFRRPGRDLADVDSAPAGRHKNHNRRARFEDRPRRIAHGSAAMKLLGELY